MAKTAERDGAIGLVAYRITLHHLQRLDRPGVELCHLLRLAVQQRQVETRHAAHVEHLPADQLLSLVLQFQLLVGVRV